MRAQVLQASRHALTVARVTPTAVLVNYSALPAATPNAHGHTVAIWQNTQVPWQAPPLHAEAVPRDGQIGSLSLSNLLVQQKPYILAYLTGPVGERATSVAATARINGSDPGETCDIRIRITYIDNHSLAIAYQTPPGYLPRTYGNWIGLWPGQASPYTAQQADAQSVRVGTDWNIGEVMMSGLELRPGMPYTLVYFTGDDMRNAAALLTFVPRGGEETD